MFQETSFPVTCFDLLGAAHWCLFGLQLHGALEGAVHESSPWARGRDLVGSEDRCCWQIRLGGGKEYPWMSSWAGMAPQPCCPPIMKVLLCNFKENRENRENRYVSCLWQKQLQEGWVHIEVAAYHGEAIGRIQEHEAGGCTASQSGNREMNPGVHAFSLLLSLGPQPWHGTTHT